MKTLLLILPACAAMLFMSSCASPLVPFPLSLVTNPAGGFRSSFGAGGIDQTTMDAIDQSNRNNAFAQQHQSQAIQDSINTQNMIDTRNMINTQNMIDTQNMVNAQNAAAMAQPVPAYDFHLLNHPKKNTPMKTFLLILPACAGLLLLSSCGSISIGSGGDSSTSNDDSSHATQDWVNQQQANDNTQNMVNQITADSAQAAMTPIPPQ